MKRGDHHSKQLARRETVEVHPVPLSTGNAERNGSRNTRKVIWAAALASLLVAGFTATLFSVYSAEQLADAERVVTLELRGPALDTSATQQVLSAGARMEGAPSFVLWEQRSLEYVQNPTLGRSAKVNVVLAQGDVDLIVKGSFLPEKDLVRSGGAIDDTASEVPATSFVLAAKGSTQRCIIDAATARELFGDSNVVGLHARYGSEDFIVDEVVESARPLFLARPTVETGVAFDMVTVHNVSAQPSDVLGERMASGLGLDAEVLKYGLLSFLAQLLSWLPTFLLAVVYLVFLLCQGFAKNNSSRHQALFLVGFLLGSVALTVFIAFHVHLPRDMIPSRFSDFALWQQIRDDTGAALANLFDAAVYVPAASIPDNFFTAMTFSVISLILYLGAIWLLAQVRFVAGMPQHVRKRAGVIASRLSEPRHLPSRLSYRKDRDFYLPRGGSKSQGRHL